MSLFVPSSMEIIKPKGKVTQKFGKNFNSSYSEGGLKGHTGIDYVNGHKSVINAVVNGEVYSTLNMRNPDTDKYRAVYQLVDGVETAYEVSFGHVDKSFVSKGEYVYSGQPLATQGNFGLCYTNGKKVTKAQKKLGIGSHLHFQARKLVKVKKRDRKKKYLRDNNQYLKRDGYYYEVVNYDNGYNGCVDPALHYSLSLKELFNLILILKRLGIIND